MGVTPDFKFGSHLPVLMKAVALTDGPVLEMGMGNCSTIFLHWACATKKRPLVSYENDPMRFRWAREFECDFHEVHCINDWTKVDINQPWDVVLIDHHPVRCRLGAIRTLANVAKYIVAHDTQGRSNRIFRYSEVFPLFKWQYNYDFYLPKTSVLSNLVDLTDFGKDWE
jgi:hypothetical protein